MKLASWNVNSIKARRERLLQWLSKHAPDVLCLQELKCELEAFPTAEIEALGYHVAVLGQRTYNGVAILAKHPIEDVTTGLADDDQDPEARLISARIDGLRVICCYVPNGQTLDSPKYAYKLRWLERLHAYLARVHSADEALVVCGDFNIAPEDRDCCDPPGWIGSVLCHTAAREKWHTLIAWGLVDTYRLHVQDAGKYSWWDYRMLSFPKGQGLRIDHVLATRSVANRCSAASIDRDERKGKLPSDHAPVIVELTVP